MAATSRVERVRTSDGELDAYVALPESGSGPGIVVLQEIFGVGGYIKEATERLAGIGYVALAAPDLYWRIAPGIAIDHTEAGMGEAFQTAQQLDHQLAVSDSIAALKTLRGLREVPGGKAGGLGFCLGGTLRSRWRCRAIPTRRSATTGPGIPEMLDRAEEIHCTVLFHYGGQDQYIPGSRPSGCARSRGRNRTWSATSSSTPGTRSTTTRLRCSTSRSPPPAHGR